ncbi:MAG: DUF222 domain-containing protein [Pseudonocardiales bacterium]|nr:DUF222 domain-containing protein [Pseudonocardiales bacterium]
MSRIVYSVMLDAVAELESRNIAATAGFRNTKQLLAGMLNLSATDAGTRVAHASQLAARRTLGGEVLAPVLPNTAAALAAGEIGPGQVRAITETINAIPASVLATERDAAEVSWPATPGRSTRHRCTRSAFASWRTSTPTVHSPATSGNPIRPLGSCGCGTAGMGGWAWRDTSNPSTVPRSDL